ncbi:MAG TPA: DUF2149 domain-containing protein [Bacillota bacterium]|nr:DUF2149 domain-containing protein [Bacillota bacterium]
MKRKYGRRLDRENPVEEDVNPLEGVPNLADIMLVLACGLMLALIINWNVDVAGLNETVQNRAEVKLQMEGLAEGPDSKQDEMKNYVEKGIVYEDPVTGKLYMVKNE